MLILTRRVGERLTIGNDIEVAVTRVRGQQVQLGILAPDDVPIRREELDMDGDEEHEDPVEDALPRADEQ